MAQHDSGANGQVRVQFWGVRGSIPTPGPATTRYGGNTSCVTVEGPDGVFYIFDSGSGIRPFGMSLVMTRRLPVTAHLMLTHTHWDHIQGLPFFVPAFIPGNQLHIYSSKAGAWGDWTLEDVLSGQMSEFYFPVNMEVFGADLSFTHLRDGEHQIGAAKVLPAPLNHPGGDLGYRLELAGRVIAVVWDEEPLGGPEDLTPNPNALQLARGADLLIHDAQYTDREYREGKVGWGHSPLSYVVNVAVAAGVRQLVLFHHDPMHDDSFVERMVADARRMAEERGVSTAIVAATEGTAVELPAVTAAAPTGHTS